MLGHHSTSSNPMTYTTLSDRCPNESEGFEATLATLWTTQPSVAQPFLEKKPAYSDFKKISTCFGPGNPLALQDILKIRLRELGSIKFESCPSSASSFCYCDFLGAKIPEELCHAPTLMTYSLKYSFNSNADAEFTPHRPFIVMPMRPHVPIISISSPNVPRGPGEKMGKSRPISHI